MKEYHVKSEDTKHFRLSLNDQPIGELNYLRWFSFKAEMNLEGDSYTIEPKGFWGTTIELKQAGNVLLKFQMNWNGNIIISSRFDETERDFILKHKGLFKDSYVLMSKEEEELLVIKPDFKWTKFNYDYHIITTDQFDQLPFNKILILTTIHCVNYYMAMMSTGMQ